MNFNVYLDDATAKRLDALARREKVARNALIRRAVDALLERGRQNWPDIVMQWKGDPDAVPYESYRAELLGPNDDPLGVLRPQPEDKRAKRRPTPRKRARRAA